MNRIEKELLSDQLIIEKPLEKAIQEFLLYHPIIDYRYQVIRLDFVKHHWCGNAIRL